MWQFSVDSSEHVRKVLRLFLTQMQLFKQNKRVCLLASIKQVDNGNFAMYSTSGVSDDGIIVEVAGFLEAC